LGETLLTLTVLSFVADPRVDLATGNASQMAGNVSIMARLVKQSFSKRVTRFDTHARITDV
jgi:hypothetical protein